MGTNHASILEFDLDKLTPGLFPQVAARNVAPAAPAGYPVQDIHAAVFGKDGKFYYPLNTTGPLEKGGKPQAHLRVMRFDPATKKCETVGIPEVVGLDEETDIAVIKVNAGRDLPAVTLGNSDDMQVGDWVLAIGSPFGLEQTVTAGIISTKERQTDQGAAFRRFIQTDAAINRGNSGGPLVNMRGEVIGINSQIATSTGDYNGIGFALPSNIADSAYKQLITTGKVRRGYLGVYLDSVKPEFARVYEMPKAAGAIIRDMATDKGPAEKAGMQTNDIIVDYNGQPVENAQDLINKVASTPIGQTVQIGYLREVNNKLEHRTASVTVGERPPRTTATIDDPNATGPDGKKLKLSPMDPNAPTSSKNGSASAGDRPTLGLTLSELTPQIANERNLKGVRGLFVKDVDQAGIAFDAGVQKNMVIQRVNRQPVNTIEDF